jgi:hypothetical protein
MKPLCEKIRPTEAEVAGMHKYLTANFDNMLYELDDRKRTMLSPLLSPR